MEDSHGKLALCVNLGSAARLVTGVGRGSEVVLARAGSGEVPPEVSGEGC